MAAPSLQRLLPAAGVALAVALLGFGAVGMAAAEGAGGLPETFRLAERHAGDRGVYRDVDVLVGGADDGSDLVSEGRLRFEWSGEQAFLEGRDGTWRAVHGRLFGSDAFVPLGVGDVQTKVPIWWIDWVDSATQATVGHSGVVGGSGGSSGSSVLPLSRSQSETTVDVETDWSGAEGCTLEAVLAAGVRLDTPIQLPQGCAGDGPGFVYEASASSVDGVPTVRFEAAVETDWGTYWEATEYATGIPEPLRQEWSRSKDGAVLSHGFRALAGFERGAGPWHSGLALPEPLDLPGVQLALRDPWGPSEAGVAHPFPASAAWAAARDDPADASFRDYLAAHPQAAAAASRYSEEAQGNQTQRTWIFHVQPTAQGGQDRFLASVTQAEGPAGAAATDLLGLPLQAPVPVASTSWFGGPVTSAGLGQELPAEVPTVASVMARWREHTGAREMPNGWGFAGGEVFAGRTGVTVPAARAQDVVNGSQRSGNATGLLLAIGPDGVPTRLLQEETTARYVQMGLVSDAPAAAPSPQPSKPSPRLALAGVAWAAPSAPAASGAAAVSLLAGLLYWLWPALKGAPAGLFSRIQSPRLLDHPVRRSLVDAVEANPGIHYQALVRLAGSGKGATEHHLRKLVTAGLLVRHQGPGYTCFFPPRTDHRVAAAAGVLKSASARRVLEAVQAQPGISSVRLAAVTGLDASTVSHHVHRLAGAGLLEPSRVGRTLAIRPTGLAGAALGAA